MFHCGVKKTKKGPSPSSTLMEFDGLSTPEKPRKKKSSYRYPLGSRIGKKKSGPSGSSGGQRGHPERRRKSKSEVHRLRLRGKGPPIRPPSAVLIPSTHLLRDALPIAPVAPTTFERLCHLDDELNNFWAENAPCTPSPKRQHRGLNRVSAIHARACASIMCLRARPVWAGCPSINVMRTLWYAFSSYVGSNQCGAL